MKYVLKYVEVPKSYTFGCGLLRQLQTRNKSILKLCIKYELTSNTIRLKFSMKMR